MYSLLLRSLLVYNSILSSEYIYNTLGDLFMNADSIYTNASGDFDVTVNVGTKTIDISGMTFTVLNKNIQAGALRLNGKEVSLAGSTISGNTITIPKIADLEAGDVIVLYLVGPPRAWESSADSLKTIVQNPDKDEYDVPFELCEDTALSITKTVLGSEIDKGGRSVLGLYITTSNGDSTGMVLSVSTPTTTGGTDYHTIENITLTNNTSIYYEVSNIKAAQYIVVEGIRDNIGSTPTEVTISISAAY